MHIPASQRSVPGSASAETRTAGATPAELACSASAIVEYTKYVSDGTCITFAYKFAHSGHQKRAGIGGVNILGAQSRRRIICIYLVLVSHSLRLVVSVDQRIAAAVVMHRHLKLLEVVELVTDFVEILQRRIKQRNLKRSSFELPVCECCTGAYAQFLRQDGRKECVK